MNIRAKRAQLTYQAKIDISPFGERRSGEGNEILGWLRQLSEWKLRGDTGISGEAGHRHALDTTLPSSWTEINDMSPRERRASY